jgi:hypothetical protein
MQFTEHQVRELEDVIINILSPVHIKMQIALHKKRIGQGDVKFTIKQLDRIVKYLHDLRSKELRMTRKGSREL